MQLGRHGFPGSKPEGGHPSAVGEKRRKAATQNHPSRSIVKFSGRKQKPLVQGSFQSIPSRSFMALISVCICRKFIAYPGWMSSLIPRTSSRT